MSTPTDDRGIGVFWGDDGAAHEQESSARLPLLVRPPVQASPITTRLRKPPIMKNSISLPDLQSAASTQLVLDHAAESASAHDSTLSLLNVLQTLWRSIAKDTREFVTQINDGTELRVANPRHLCRPYYTGRVYHEDKPYFLREKQAEFQRESTQKQVQAYRQLQCATDDQQRYIFDRRKRRSSSTPCRFTKQVENDFVENRLIDRHDHKIQHLLHVLQTEMARETQREIRALNNWSPHKPLSRQGKRQIADIIKERYEAADRIMRILEDYHIVIGVDAARYLEETVARGCTTSH